MNDVDAEITTVKFRPKDPASNVRPDSGYKFTLAVDGSKTLEMDRSADAADRGAPLAPSAVYTCTKMVERIEPPDDTDSARASCVTEYRPAPHAGSESMMEKAMP